MKLEPHGSELGQYFRSLVKGLNFMTPDLLGYIRYKNGVAEITTGASFLGIEMYGVTIIYNGEKSDEKSKCFNSLEECEKYINTLNL